MTATIHPSAVIHPNVEIGEDGRVGAFCILGSPPEGAAPEEAPLRIGRGAVIRSHSVIYGGNQIGDRLHVGHAAMIRESNQIGHDVSIGTHSIVEHHVRIGDGVRIHSGAFIPEFSVIEAGAWIGPHAVLTNARYPLGADAKRTLEGPVIGAGAKIGANATLLPGVNVGRGALVGAGSVVVDDVPDGAVVVGNPARKVNDVGKIPSYNMEAD